MIVVVLVVIVVVAGILLFAATRPDAYGIQRVTTIGAPPERILPLLIDKQWPNWSPFEALDPTMERTYSGAPTGKGAVYEWEGNRQAGKGRMEIVDVSPPKSVTIHVDFVKPFDAHNINQFTLEPRGNATVVTWSMRGTQPFALKAMSIFVSPDRLLGKHFETGLANLKATAERNA